MERLRPGRRGDSVEAREKLRPTPCSPRLVRRRDLLSAAVAAAATSIGLPSQRAHATNHGFSASGSTTWNTAPWSPAGVPVAGDVASISPYVFGDLTLTFDGFYNTPLDTLNLDGAFGFGVYFQQNGSFMYSLNENIGMFGPASYTQTDGLNLGVNLNLAHGGGPSGFGMYTLAGNGSLVMSNENVGEFGNATFTQSAGANTLNSSGYSGLYLGYNAGGFGTYTLSGSGNLTVNGYEVIGTYGSGNFVQSGGTHTINGTAGLFIGAGSGGGGTFTLSGGTLSLPTTNVAESIGYTEFGVFNQNGGSHSISGSGGQLVLGYNAGATGIYNLTAGTINVAQNEIVGHGGNGQFNQSGGTNTTANLYLANLGRTNGNYNLSNGATLTVTGSEYDGVLGSGTFNQTGGSHSVNGGLYVGYSVGSTGVYNLSNPQSTLSAPFTYVGYSDSGTFYQNGGTHSVGNTLSIGYNSTSAGVYNLNGGALVIGFEEIVGASGTGTLNQTGGIQSIANRLSLGYSPGSTGYFNLSGGQTTMHGPTFVGGSIFGPGGYGLLNISGGTFDATGNSIQVYATSNGPSPSEITLNGGVLNVASLVLPDWNRLVFNSGTLNLGAGPNSNPGTLTVGNVGGPAVLNQTNAASLVSAGSVNIGSGATGTYNLSNGASLSVTASTTVGVFGSGIFNQYGGSHSVDTLFLAVASNSVGTYNLSNSATLTQSGSFEYIGNFGNGTFNHTGGTHTLAGTLILGNLVGSTGIYNLTGNSSSLSVANGNILVGNSGSGAFYDVGGVATTQGLVLGVNAGSTGICSLALSPLLNSAYDTVGSFGNGIFNQAGGTHTTGSISIGIFPSSSGTFTLSGGQLNTSGNIYVGGGAGGAGGYGQLNLTGGNLSLGANSVIIYDTSSGTNHSGLNIAGGPYTIYAIITPDWNRASLHGTLNLGPGVSSNAGTLILGDSPGVSATLNQTLGGGLVSAFNLVLGSDPLSRGFYNLDNGASLSAALAESIGAAGAGTFNQMGGVNTVALLNSGGSPGLYLGYGAGGNGMYALSGAGNLIVNGSESIGIFGYGNFIQTGGTNTINGNGLYVGGGSGGGGTFTLAGGLLSLPTPNVIESIGDAENGVFNQTGGSNSVSGSGSQLVLGYSPGSSGTYNLTAGSLTVALNEVVGHFGNGTFNHSGGSNTTANLYLANQPGSVGVYNLSNGASLTVTDSEYVGVLGAGAFNQTNGSHTLGGSLFVGYTVGGGPAGGGTFTLSGGALTVSGVEYVGYGERGAFIQNGGIHSPAELNVGTAAWLNNQWTGILGVGDYLLSGGSLDAQTEIIGDVSVGSFTQTAGINHAQFLFIANSYAQSATGLAGNPIGSYQLSGGTLTVDRQENVGNAGFATFVQNGGSHSVHALLVGANPGGNGTYTLGAGELDVNGDEKVGYIGKGSFFQNGGVHNVAATLSLGIPQAGSAGSFVLSGGSLSAGSVSISSHGTFSLLSGVMTATSLVSLGVYSQSGGTATLGPASGSAALSIADGTFTLSDGSLGAAAVSITGGAFHQSGGSFQFSHVQQQGGSALFDGSANLIVDNADYALTGGTLTVANVELIGTSGTGSFQQSGASVHSLTSTTTNGLFLGFGPAATGSYQLDGGTLASGATVWIGYGGAGTLTQTGGSLTIGNDHALVLGGLASGNGVYNQSGGTLSAEYEYVGYLGNGLFNHTGGTNSTGALFVGSPTDVSSTATYLLGGSASLIASGAEYVGDYGAGVFVQTGGSNTCNSTLFIGGPRGGTYSLGGGALTVNGYTVVGFSGPSLFQQTGGIHSINSTGTNGLFLGYTSFGAGDYHLDGGTLASGATVWIGYGGTGTLTQTAGTLTVGNGHALVIGGLSGSTGSYNLQGGTLNPTNEYLGEDGDATFVHSGGSNFTGLLALGLGTNLIGSGAYTLSGAGSLNASTAEYVGYVTQGTFNQSGGTNVTPFLGLGTLGPSATGAYSLSAGTLQTDSETIGNFGSGVFTQTGGSHTINGTSGFFLAGATGATGNYALSAGQLSVANGPTFVGYAGNGTFNHSGGINTTAGLYLASQTNSVGTYNLSNGASLSVTFAESIGSGGEGTFNQTGGVHTFSGTTGLLIGAGVGGGGTYNLSGGTLALTTGYGYGEYVGYTENATFNQSGGTNSITQQLYIGYNAGVSGTYNLSGGNLSVGQVGTVVGFNGRGTFNQTSGVVASSELHLGYVQNSIGVYSMSNDASLSVSQITVGEYGNGTLNQNGGTLSTTIFDVGLVYPARGTVNQTAGFSSSIQMDIGSQGGAGAYNLSGGQATVAASLTLGEDGVGLLKISGGLFDAHACNIEAPNIGATNSVAITVSGGTLLANSLHVFDWHGLSFGNGVINHGGGTSSNAGNLMIGDGSVGGGDATFNQTNGGAVFVGSDLVLANSNLCRGDYNLGGAAALLTVRGYEYVAKNGQGFFTQTGGGNSALVLSIGDALGSSGIYTLNGPSASATFAAATVGSAGGGVFDQYAGNVAVGGNLEVAYFHSALGTYAMYADTLSADTEEIGEAGAGTFYQYGGSNLTGHLIIGLQQGSTGVYNLSGAAASLLVTSDETIAPFGSGAFNQSGGTHTISGSLMIASSSGTMNLMGGACLVASNITNRGAINQSGGALSASALSNVGVFSQTAGQATFGPLSGTGSTVVGGGGGSALLSVSSLTQKSLAINGGGTVALRAAPVRITNSVNTLSITGTGLLDLANHALLVDNAATPENAVRQYLHNAYNADASGIGNWLGTGGITSADAIASHNGANPDFHISAGYVNGASANDPLIGGSIPGQETLPTNRILIRPALYGDLNLDGKVDDTDLAIFSGLGQYNQPNPKFGWLGGDLNYDGKVDDTDLLIFSGAGNYNGPSYGANLPTASHTSATPTLTAHTESNGDIILSASTSQGAPGDGVLDFVYDPATGHLTLSYDGDPRVTAAQPFQVVRFKSAGGHFIPANFNQTDFGAGVTATTTALNGTASGSNSVPDGYDMGAVLPTGLTVSDLTSDLTLQWNVFGGGLTLKNGDVVVPEPAFFATFAATALAVNARRQRRRRRT